MIHAGIKVKPCEQRGTTGYYSLTTVNHVEDFEWIIAFNTKSECNYQFMP